MAVSKQISDDVLAEVEALVAQGASDRAVSLLQGQAAEKNVDYRLLEKLGLLLTQRREFDAAVECLQRLIRLKPNMAQAQAALAAALEAAGEHQKAESHYSLALELGWTGQASMTKVDGMQTADAGPDRPEKNAACAEKMVQSRPDKENFTWPAASNGPADGPSRGPARAEAVTTHHNPQALLAVDDDLFVISGSRGCADPEATSEETASAPSRAVEETEGTAAAPDIGRLRLRILFVREKPDERLFAMARALTALGHEVNLGHRHPIKDLLPAGAMSAHFAAAFVMADYQHLWNVSDGFDIIHCQSTADVFSCAALVGKAKVIHDSHGLNSQSKPDDKSIKYFEGLANRGAHGRVYISAPQMEEAKMLYGVDGPSIILGDDPAEIAAGIGNLEALYYRVLGLNGPAAAQDQPAASTQAAVEDGKRTLLLVNADVDYSGLLEALVKEPGQVVVGSVDKGLMEKIRRGTANTMGPDDVGQTFWLQKHDWGVVYPDRKTHYDQFQKLFKPLMDLPKVRRFGNLDMYSEEEFNQAHGVGFSYLKLIDILYDMLEQYRPDRVISLENGSPQVTPVSTVIQDIAKNMGFEVKVLREQKAAGQG